MNSSVRDNLLLFPLCDQRGALTSLLKNPHSGDVALCKPEPIFFAWLLDLPDQIAPATAARGVLQFAGYGFDAPPEDNSSRYRLYQLLKGQTANTLEN